MKDTSRDVDHLIREAQLLLKKARRQIKAASTSVADAASTLLRSRKKK